jgi:hypothetical protein
LATELVKALVSAIDDMPPPSNFGYIRQADAQHLVRTHVQRRGDQDERFTVYALITPI